MFEFTKTPDLNTLRPRRNEQHFADDIFKRIFFNENVWISIKISLKFVPKGPINNISALVQIMAWRRSGDKPLSDPMLVSLPTHICVTRPQWVKQWRAGLKWIWHSLCPSWYTLLRARPRPANTNTGKPSCYPADQHVWFPSWLTSLYTSRCPRQGPSTTPEGPCCRQWTSRRRPGLRSCRHRGLHNMSQTAGITMSLRECVLWLLRSSPEVRWKRRKFSRYSLSISHGSLPN